MAHQETRSGGCGRRCQVWEEWPRYWSGCHGTNDAVWTAGGGGFKGVKRKSPIFFFWRKSLIFFFRRKSRVEKKTEKCMIRDLRFFCDATYTKKKSYATYAFFDTRPTAKKK